MIPELEARTVSTASMNSSRADGYRILGARLQVVGVVDKNVSRAESVLAKKRADKSVASAYTSTTIFTSLDEAGATLTSKGTLPQYVPTSYSSTCYLELRTDAQSRD
jgi:hypothetical protein